MIKRLRVPSARNVRISSSLTGLSVILLVILALSTEWIAMAVCGLLLFAAVVGEFSMKELKGMPSKILEAQEHTEEPVLLAYNGMKEISPVKGLIGMRGAGKARVLSGFGEGGEDFVISLKDEPIWFVANETLRIQGMNEENGGTVISIIH